MWLAFSSISSRARCIMDIELGACPKIELTKYCLMLGNALAAVNCGGISISVRFTPCRQTVKMNETCAESCDKTQSEMTPMMHAFATLDGQHRRRLQIFALLNKYKFGFMMQPMRTLLSCCGESVGRTITGI